MTTEKLLLEKQRLIRIALEQIKEMFDLEAMSKAEIKKQVEKLIRTI